jgi:hypothetical protein
MKKIAPKLMLRRETLRTLANLELEQARGGVNGTENPGICNAAAPVVASQVPGVGTCTAR